MLNADEVGGSVTQAQGLTDTTLSKANCLAARVFAIIERVQLTFVQQDNFSDPKRKNQFDDNDKPWTSHILRKLDVI